MRDYYMPRIFESNDGRSCNRSDEVPFTPSFYSHRFYAQPATVRDTGDKLLISFVRIFYMFFFLFVHAQSSDLSIFLSISPRSRFKRQRDLYRDFVHFRKPFVKSVANKIHKL